MLVFLPRFSKVVPALVMPPDKTNVSITDRDPAAEIEKSLNARGIQVILA
jgi:hypothetical protein